MRGDSIASACQELGLLPWKLESAEEGTIVDGQLRWGGGWAGVYARIDLDNLDRSRVMSLYQNLERRSFLNHNRI